MTDMKQITSMIEFTGKPYGPWLIKPKASFPKFFIIKLIPLWNRQKPGTVLGSRCCHPNLSFGVPHMIVPL